jgi:hypothetical protein
MNIRKKFDDAIDYGKQAIAEKDGWLSRIRDAIRLWFPIKILFAFLGALTGASILGFLSEYAAYSYALQCGIRPPLEGVPYLRAFVTVISVVLILSCMLVFFIYFSFLSYAEKFIFDFPRKFANKIRSMFGRKPIDKNILISHLSAKLTTFRDYAAALTLVIISYLSDHLITLPYIEYITGVPKNSFILYYYLLPFFLLCVFWIATKRFSAMLVTVTLTCLTMCFAIAILFHPSVYASLLRSVGYGGGTRVVIEMLDRKSQSEYVLLLRTNDALIVRDEQRNEIIEIPNMNVRTISHQPGGLGNLPFSLPWTETSKSTLSTNRQ